MENVCESCRQPKASFKCGVCENSLCKQCRVNFEPDEVALLKKIPKELSQKIYCNPCYEKHVVPALEIYNQTLERAKESIIIFKTQRKGIPILRRSKHAVRVEDCPDRDETILRLAFYAAEQSFNAVVDVEVIAEKIRNAGYQTSRWSGVGYPAEVDAEKLNRQDELEKKYR